MDIISNVGLILSICPSSLDKLIVWVRTFEVGSGGSSWLIVKQKTSVLVVFQSSTQFLYPIPAVRVVYVLKKGHLPTTHMKRNP